MNYSIFDKNTGRLKSSSTMPDDYEIPESDGIIVYGKFDGKRHYLNLNTSLVEDAGDAPSAFHYLSGMSGWVLDRNAAESVVRAHRDTLLSNCDWVEFPSAKTRVSEEDLIKWFTYRQALRDVTLQKGFPLTIEWPISPK